VVQVQDEAHIGRDRRLIGLGGFLVAEGHALPVLPLVPAQVQDLEGLAVGDAQQALAGGVDGEAAEVAADPAASFSARRGWPDRKKSRRIIFTRRRPTTRSIAGFALRNRLFAPAS
jgi:hypothetical protein